jgi:hypothetical protein
MDFKPSFTPAHFVRDMWIANTFIASL